MIPVDAIKLIEQAMHLAHSAVVADIESYCTRESVGELTYWDTSHWVNPNEHASQEIDMAHQAIQYAVNSGIAVRHPHRPQLLRIVDCHSPHQHPPASGAAD